MEGLVDTDPVPVVEGLETSSAKTMGPGCAEPTGSDGSGGDGSEESCAWSLTVEQQVDNLVENRKRFTNLQPTLFVQTPSLGGITSKLNPWFARVVSQLRVDPCSDSPELELNRSLLRVFQASGLNMSSFKMSCLELVILMGDLKMVREILERSSDPRQLLRGSLLDRESVFREFLFFSSSSEEAIFFCTPLHLAVVGGDSHIMDVLLEKGADVNAQNWLGETPLDFACKLGSVNMLLKLLTKDKYKKDPLLVAVRCGDDDFIKKLPSPKVNALDCWERTPLHHLATAKTSRSPHVITNILKYLDRDKALDVKALDRWGLSAFYVAVVCCNTEVVIALLESFKDRIRLNEACDEDLGPPIQIAFEGGYRFKDIERALMEREPIKGYMETLYRDRQVYVDAANAILVGAALIASVTFASWLQPPLSYTSYFGEGSSSSVPSPSTSNLSYVDVEHNIALRAFWIFNALSFYFAIATVVCGARSVLPRSHLFIKKTVDKLRTNLLVTSILLACSVLFVIVAFAIAGTIVLTPLLKYQWCMIVPTLVGGIVCIISLVFLVKSIREIFSNTGEKINPFHIRRNLDYLSDWNYKILY